MAKYEELYEDVQELFDQVIDIADLGHLVDIKVISDSKLKTIGKVQKANDLLNYLGDGVDVIITINQIIFDQLPQDLKEMVAIELLTYVVYDREKDKLIIDKPDVTTFSGVLKRFGYDRYEVLQESIKSLYDKKQNDDAQAEDAGAEE
jgi:TRAP-type mannitol/chloroaromatic compound transport system substrate-binding protein